MVDAAGVGFADGANVFFKLTLRKPESLPLLILPLGFAPGVRKFNWSTRGNCGADWTTQDQLFLGNRKIATANIRVRAGKRYLLVMRSHAIEREVPAHLISSRELNYLACATRRQVQVDASIEMVRRAEVPPHWVDHCCHRIEQTDKVDAGLAAPFKVF